MANNETDVSINLRRVMDSIRVAEAAAGRQEGEVSLLAVSKMHSAQEVMCAAVAGQMSFGENRVQEAAAKFEEVRDAFPDVHLHIIGTLQSNKIKKAVSICGMIESVDSIACLEAIEKHCAALGKTMKVLLELHTGEASKAGFADTAAMRSALTLCAEGKLPHIVPCGFMTMAPLTSDEKLQRQSFSALRDARDALLTEFPMLPLKTLSMGMSADYRAAIMEGSTEVRIGSAIFGSRGILAH